jgi:hypothetical protein
MLCQLLWQGPGGYKMSQYLAIFPHCDLHYLLFVTRCMNYAFTTQTTVIIMWWMLLWKPCISYCSHHLLNFYQSYFPPKGWLEAASRLPRDRRNWPNVHSVSVI